MAASNEKIFCPQPWKGLATSPSGSVRLCCLGKADLNLAYDANDQCYRLPTDLQAALNSELFRQVRQKFNAGTWPAVCQSCQTREAQGLKSQRLRFLDDFPEMKSGEAFPEEIELKNIQMLDIRMGNNCNLKCRMCSPYSSSAWLSDWDKLTGLVQPIEDSNRKRWSLKWYDREDVWQNLFPLLPNLRSIFLKGGEPLLNAGNNILLRECVRLGYAKQLSIYYHTNGTIWNEEAVALWAEFKHVDLRISIDGIGKLNDFIRSPSQWHVVYRNLKRFQTLPIAVSIQSTISPYNIFSLPQIEDFFRNEGLSCFLWPVEDPPYLSLETLPPKIAARARSVLDRVPGDPYSEFKKRLNSSRQDLWPHFLAYSSRLDQLRKQSLENLVPELFDSYDLTQTGVSVD